MLDHKTEDEVEARDAIGEILVCLLVGTLIGTVGGMLGLVGAAVWLMVAKR